MAKATAVREPQAEVESAEARKDRIAKRQADLKAEREALKAEQKSGTPLEKVEARQQQHNERLGLLLARMLRGRLNAGQSREDAIEAVTGICRTILTNMPETVEASEEAADESDE